MTTPKGAAALAILLGAASIYAPFAFNLAASDYFGAVCSFTIIWIYAGDAWRFLKTGKWNVGLVIPVTCIAAIFGMGLLARKQVAAELKPVPAINSDMIAERVGIRVGQQLEEFEEQERRRDRKSSRIHAVGLRIKPEASLAPPAHDMGTAVSQANASAPIQKSWLDDFSEKIKTQNEQISKFKSCLASESAISIGVSRLDFQAVNAMNNYASSKDDKKIQVAFDDWVSSVEAFLSANPFRPSDVVDFEKASDANKGNTFLFIHNSGTHVWLKFQAKRNALREIATHINLHCNDYTKF